MQNGGGKQTRLENPVNRAQVRPLPVPPSGPTGGAGGHACQGGQQEALEFPGVISKGDSCAGNDLATTAAELGPGPSVIHHIFLLGFRHSAYHVAFR